MKKNIKNKAFTLIEVVVALGLLAVIIGAIVTVEVQATKITTEAKHRIEAMSWSQKGLNTVQKTRDENLLTGNSAMTGIGVGEYYLDGDVLTKCPSSPSPCVVPSSGKINNDGLNFTQIITIKQNATP